MPNDKVDILRISHNVKQNMKDKDSYAVAGPAPPPAEDKNDFQLNNRDMELNFGGEGEVEEEDDGSAAELSSNPSASVSNTIETAVDLTSAEKDEKYAVPKEEHKGASYPS